jgi:hypothetical protein
MSLVDDLINCELCFPGSLTGYTTVRCPYCEEAEERPVGSGIEPEVHSCENCGRVFIVDWGEGVVRPIEDSVDN